MTGTPIQPPDVHPDDAPLVCLSINATWVSYLIGMVYPARYPEYWGGTLEQNRIARKDVLTLMSILQSLEDCGMASECCEPIIYIYRINPDTGAFERSPDDGGTWLPDPADPIHTIRKLAPLSGIGVTKTKCDAATNFLEHFEDIITAQSENIGTAITVFELATAIAAVIIDIIVAILTEGAGAVAIIAITDAIFASAAAAFAEGKTAFDDYWTNDNKDLVLCAAFCTIGEDGQFTQTQWEDFKHKVRADLPAGAALDFVMTAVNAGGYVGGSNMASYGTAADSECGDCVCEEGCSSAWFIQTGFGDIFGHISARDADSLTIETTGINTDGKYYIEVRSPSADDCCYVTEVDTLTGGITSTGNVPCGTTPDAGNFVPGDAFHVCVTGIQYSSSAPFSVQIFLGECP